jgi:alkaline phosphatase D
MNTKFSRRDFLVLSAKGVGMAIISSGLMGCDLLEGNSDINVSFNHGVASGDPTQNAIILWTRITPDKDDNIKVTWQIATDPAFNNITHTGETLTNKDKDYTVKLDAVNLQSSTQYYYRFMANGRTSKTGKTKTLASGNIDSLNLAVMSCANFPTGYFNVYDLASTLNSIDVVLHLGDYIYEYARDEYASKHAAKYNREVLPAGELFTLSDYRTRYAQYRTDASLQKLHGHVPFITVWDDHEVANDTYKDGADNHNEQEGDFTSRKLAALQAYFEWLPIRPIAQGNEEEIYRSFTFGNLVDLHMLDTRVLGRDKQLKYSNYFNAETEIFDAPALEAAITDPTRTMLGETQLLWLQNQLASSTGSWQLLGQQVLMGKMLLPAAVVLNLLSFAKFAELGALAILAGRLNAGDPTLSEAEIQYISANQAKLTPQKIAQLQLPYIPYNLDAWDGYGYERDVILQTAKAYQKNLVVIAGDTHNGWSSELVDNQAESVGVEFATSSVTSPGLEYYLGIEPKDIPATEQGITSLIANLKYCNLKDRGFMLLNFTHTEVTTTWHYVDTIESKSYGELTTRRKIAKVKIGHNNIELSD